jgi:hypothetical protein
MFPNSDKNHNLLNKNLCHLKSIKLKVTKKLKTKLSKNDKKCSTSVRKKYLHDNLNKTNKVRNIFSKLKKLKRKKDNTIS